MKINKILTYSLVATLGVGAISACSAKTEKAESTVESNKTDEKTETKKLKVVSTIFPSYDWAKEVIGDQKENYDLTLLLDKGTDLHSYQPTADDIAKISECDLFIYVGGESDGWVNDAIKSAKNKNMKVINLVETLGDAAKTEEMVEGMQDDEHEHEEGEAKDHDSEEGEAKEHDHEEGEAKDHDHDHDHEEGEEEIDEHVWLSLKNAGIYVDAIEKALADIDKDNSSKYEENAKNYIEKLDNLDKEYENTVKSAKNNTLLFGDRFPFRYLVDDYGLKYYAAFVGCSAETEASFNTVIFLANKVDELNLKNVLTIENSDGKIAKTIIDNTKDKNEDIMVLNSMQSVTSKDVESGVTYLSIMESNLDVLKKALN